MMRTEEQRLKYNDYQNNYRKKKKLCELCDKLISNGKFLNHTKSTIHILKKQLRELSS